MSAPPRRLRRSRAKGWRLPPGAVCVDRSTPWGNPFAVGADGTAARCVALYRALLGGLVCLSCKAGIAPQEAALAHVRANLAALRGRDLACWCRLDAPCHADVLLELANQPFKEGGADA